MRYLGYAIATLTLSVMVLGALGEHPRADDRWAYLILLGLPAATLLVLSLRGHGHAGWGFVVIAVGCSFAADHGLTLYWGYAAAFLLAEVLIQLGPVRADATVDVSTRRSSGSVADEGRGSVGLGAG